MDEIRYHPLITDGASGVMVPMFSTTDKTAVGNNKFYLEEIVPHYYRFYSKNTMSAAEENKTEIMCPYCGKAMRKVTAPIDAYKHSLYRCTKC